MKMLMNLHTHTPRCNHASGTERDYIEAAIAGGLQTLGFSDHAPYPFPNGYCSGFRMRCELMNDYVDTLLALREEYKDRIDIKIGFEAEYYPAHFADFLAMIRTRPIDYLILGQHFLGNEIGERGGGHTKDEHDLCRYVDQQIEGLSTGVFTYAAHPDNMEFVGEDAMAVNERHYSRLITYAKSMSIPLELNLLGVRDHRMYPHEWFVRLCGEIGAEVCMGCDAHSPDVTVDTASFEKMCDLATKYGAKVNLQPTLRKVLL